MHLSYTAATDAWTSLKRMPTEREDHGAAVVGSSMFAVGGTYWTGFGSAITDTNEKYVHSTDRWTTVKAVPTMRYCIAGSAVRAMGTKLIAIGGYSPLSTTDDVFEMYTPSTDTWVTKTSMPTVRYWHGVAVGGPRVYAIGGTYDPPSASPATKYDFLEVWVDSSAYTAPQIDETSPANVASTSAGTVSIVGVSFGKTDQTPSSYASGAITR